LLNKLEASAALSISTSMLDRLVREGKIRPVRLGTRVLFKVADLEAFVDNLDQKEVEDPLEPKKKRGYTWPRLGYDAPLTAQDIAALPPELRTARSVLDLMASEAGRAWWQTHGGPRVMVFDLSAGSRSRLVLQTYLENQGIRL
jgi:excisionase family DNA binding protein